MPYTRTSVTVTNQSNANVNESRVAETRIELSTLDNLKVVVGSLFEEHYEEIALNKKVMVLKPNWDVYYKAEELGTMFMFLAMKGDECLGYSLNFVINHLHYADLDYCQNDILFVQKEHRNSRLGLKLMKATENHAKSLGCKLMLWHCKEKTPLNEILPRLNYGVQDIVYSKEL